MGYARNRSLAGLNCDLCSPKQGNPPISVYTDFDNRYCKSYYEMLNFSPNFNSLKTYYLQAYIGFVNLSVTKLLVRNPVVLLFFL